MIRLAVWLTLPSGENIMAGALIVSDPDPFKGGLPGQFRYAPEYLKHPQAFPLDHLKNFIMRHDDAGWRLSPAFDLLPNISFNQEHVLRIGMDNRPSNAETLLVEAKHFGIKRRQQAMDLITEIHGAVSNWPKVFRKCYVPEKDAVNIGKDIDRRLKMTET